MMTMARPHLLLVSILLSATLAFTPSSKSACFQRRTCQIDASRREFLDQSTTSMVSGVFAAATTLLVNQPLQAQAAVSGDDDTTSSRELQISSNNNKVLVLGGTGFVGSQVVQTFQDLGVTVVATSRDGRLGTTALDFVKDDNISKKVQELAKGCNVVISCVGAIGTDQDEVINGGTALAAVAAKDAGVSRFVYISVAPEVKDFAKDIEFLRGYMKGKQQSRDVVISKFGPSSYTLIEPTFIYGGDEFKVNPPRVASFYGSFIESLLSSGPLRALTNIAPEGFIKIALEPPVPVEAVAKAAVAGALGKSNLDVLDTYDKIKDTAATIVL